MTTSPPEPPAAASEAAPTPMRTTRTVSIDVLRGLVMVLMVIDHARGFFFGMRFRPTDLDTTTVALFFTRWITHFCAPVFVFLAGTSAWLYGMRHGRDQVTRFLLLRGLWLVALELIVVRLCWVPDLGYHLTILQVIWALGWSMVALALLSRLPARATLLIGVIIVAGHNLLDPLAAQLGAALGPLWTIFHQRGRLELAPGHNFIVSYPLLPWIGVMALGYAFGAVFDRPPEARRRAILRIGIVATVGFVVLRALNLYGDPVPWTSQARGAVYTLLSFLNCEKYPPSLLFVLMTLGPALCLLAALGAWDGRPLPAAARPLVVFGRVPLLFYVSHLVLMRYVSIPLAVSKWGLAAAVQPPPGHAGSPEYPLWATYLAWAVTLLVLYPLCRWFAALKARRNDPWLSYL